MSTLPSTLLLLATTSMLGCSNSSVTLTNSKAKATLEALWDKPSLWLNVGEVGFVRKNPRFVNHTAPVSDLPLYRAAASEGFITIADERDSSELHKTLPSTIEQEASSTLPWLTAHITVTEKGRSLGVLDTTIQILKLKLVSYEVKAIVAIDCLQFGADRYRVVVGTALVRAPAPFGDVLRETRGLGGERRFKVLLKYDPFTKEWSFDRVDFAKAETFVTTNVDDRIRELQLVGGPDCSRAPTPQSIATIPRVDQQSGRGNNLTRGKAAELIIRSIGLPQVETLQLFKKYYVGQSSSEGRTALIHYGSTEDYSRAKEKLDELERRGGITVKQTSEYDNGITYQWASVDLTLEGRKHLVREMAADYQLKACEIVFGEVTGIQMNEQFKVAQASYTLKRVGSTPFSTDGCRRSDVLSRNATFSLFDDGWRIQ